VAERVAAKKGVHRDVTTNCVSCHVEHMGTSAELRPFDTRGFDHVRDANYPLDGKHAAKATECASCHKERSFLKASAACQSCHEDTHKGSLGANCTQCHSTAVAFKDSKTQFDHSKAAFQLVGSHQKLRCEQCHTATTYKVAKFAACSDCHKDPHRPVQSATCTTCHTNDTWRTTRIDHRRTNYPLAGKHLEVTCAQCHAKPAMQVKVAFATCATCHADPHKGSFKQDCKECHTERGFTDAPFDHGTTAFKLGGKHAAASCESCHKGAKSVPAAVKPLARLRGATAAASATTVDFRGLQTTCVSCHQDSHQGDLGATCESCHGDSTFKLPGYLHANTTTFYGDGHANVPCDGCHKADPLTKPIRTGTPVVLNVRYKAATTTCVSCHQDVHLGQVGTACESCHTLKQAKFAVEIFAHERTNFPLTGAHEKTTCRDCHTKETTTFPASFGTATRLKGFGQTCVSCHKDVHLGQVGATCDQCHTTSTFHLDRYEHRNATAALRSFFVGPHVTAKCEQCHVSATGRFAAGAGTAVVYKVDTRCVACHTDVHRGQLGDRCAECHRLSAGGVSPARGRGGLGARAAARVSPKRGGRP
jgi:nitrate/TMAO reductase-like tetraheme cytochrome c subunit